MSLQATTWQTVGPYFRIGLHWLFNDDVAGPNATGERVEIEGRVLDADGQGVADAMLEFWQANAAGHYAHPEDAQQKPVEEGFKGFGRVPTAEDGTFHLRTVKPGRVPGPDGKLQAPHIVVSVFMRGLLRRLITRIYFPEEPGNSEDYALNLVEPSRRPTLIARKSPKREGSLEWNVILQGTDETVFFDC
ncbi:MAG TPA: protocatechuate 3,4-dioxygenase subunit alpha [Candidatus Eremiobacteraceae bacterium]|nr:protocatechuate 3,4-dioxygenase subunit alpha [Candidatus Eremiobacteraceae bacterium]